tara:strand:- start:346 stop:543 length:198 start_codon:yes stop_codon:yes gene_type:complete
MDRKNLDRKVARIIVNAVIEDPAGIAYYNRAIDQLEAEGFYEDWSENVEDLWLAIALTWASWGEE